MPELTQIAGSFGHLLHAAGVPVTPERSARFATAIILAEPQSLTELYWLGRVNLITAHDQIDIYDRVFAQVFRGIIDMADFRGDSANQAPPAAAPTGERRPGDSERTGESNNNPRGTSATPGARDDGDDDSDEASMIAAMSTDERLSNKDFAAVTEEELLLIRKLVEQLPLVPPMRKGRRERTHSAGRRLDIRKTLRRSHRTGGDPVKLVKRARVPRPRRIVFIADISGSMEPYARVYLHLARGGVLAVGAEAFVFATRLTRLTRALSVSNPDIAYRKAAAAAPDWSGGTRIGETLMAFINEYGRRGVARGAVLVIISDGWEIEDPALVRTSMERLSRLAHHIIWVNPRKAVASFEPLTGGMAAALPYIDTFVSGHSVRALEDVVWAIRASAGDRAPKLESTAIPIGFSHAQR
ncbi:MAG: VWA containing CoxE family protein [Actinobacteria bacterium]|nr:MAG: VWA containing CoxE family protein [Actinomycetota bacterium]